MNSLRRHYNSFVVRIWWENSEADAEDEPVWRAWVQHIHSGEEAYVRNIAGLLAFFERWTGPLGSPRATRRPDDAG